MYRIRGGGVLALLAMLGQCCVGFNVSYNQPKFVFNATWNNTAETFEVVSNGSYPHSIFVDIHDSIYVSYADAQQRVSVWSNGSRTSVRNISDNMNDPHSIFVTLNGDIYVDNGKNGFISRWSTNNTYSSINIDNVSDSCYGLFIDINETIYCSILEKHKIIKRSLKNETIGWIPAGGSGNPGNPPTNLNTSQGIFVDIDFTLYVADCHNNIIQQFKPNSTNGIVTEHGTELNCPTSVVLDRDNNLYIVDNGNNRVVRIPFNSSYVQCLVGCPGSTTLNHPIDLSFDSMGNMYVTNTRDMQVLKFLLINSPDQTTTEMPTTTTEIPTTTAIPVTTTEMPTTTIENILSTSQSVSDESTSMHHLTTDRYHSTGQTVSSSTTEDIPSTSITSTKSTNEFSSSATVAHISSPNIIEYPANHSFNLCELMKPCKNSGNCTINATSPLGYHCVCATGYTGVWCEHDMSPCRSHPCLYQGTCKTTNFTNFYCRCTPERTGFRCEYLLHRCQQSTCLNRGICQPMPFGYRCQCLTNDYWGRHCEYVSTRLLIRQYISESVGYVAILVLVATITFVIVMDVLKYIFGIDPVRRERDEIRRGRALLERRNRKTRRRQGISCCQHQNKTSPQTT